MVSGLVMDHNLWSVFKNELFQTESMTDQIFEFGLFYWLN